MLKALKKWPLHCVVLVAVLLFAGCGEEAVDSGGLDATDALTALDATDVATALDADAGKEVLADSGPEAVQGCSQTTLLRTPDDPSETGPWSVGVQTLAIGRLSLVEAWYPVAPGDEAGFPSVAYDIRDTLPKSQQGLIPIEDAPLQECACHRDAPIDQRFGAYPVVIFIHGTASFRTQSLGQMLHWASRGFIVLAAQHPGLFLGDMLSLVCPDDATGGQDMVGDVAAVLAALASGGGDWASLSAHADLTRVGVAGHSAGGRAAAESGDQAGVRVVIPMASGTPTTPGDTLAFSLFMGGTADEVVPLTASESAYDGTNGARALAVFNNAPHLAFSDLCRVGNTEGENLLTIANNYGVCGAELGDLLFDCDPTLLPAETASTMINWLTTVTLEEHLQCRPRPGAWQQALAKFPDLVEIRESP